MQLPCQAAPPSRITESFLSFFQIKEGFILVKITAQRVVGLRKGITQGHGLLRHQVTELPALKPLVTEYQLHALCCRQCGGVTRAPWPEGVPERAFGPLQGFGSVEAASQFCQAFEEVRKAFRVRSRLNQAVSLAEKRGLFLERVAALNAMRMAA